MRGKGITAGSSPRSTTTRSPRSPRRRGPRATRAIAAGADYVRRRGERADGGGTGRAARRAAAGRHRARLVPTPPTRAGARRRRKPVNWREHALDQLANLADRGEGAARARRPRAAGGSARRRCSAAQHHQHPQHQSAPGRGWRRRGAGHLPPRRRKGRPAGRTRSATRGGARDADARAAGRRRWIVRIGRRRRALGARRGHQGRRPRATRPAGGHGAELISARSPASTRRRRPSLDVAAATLEVDSRPAAARSCPAERRSAGPRARRMVDACCARACRHCSATLRPPAAVADFKRRARRSAGTRRRLCSRRLGAKRPVRPADRFSATSSTRGSRLATCGRRRPGDASERATPVCRPVRRPVGRPRVAAARRARRVRARRRAEQRDVCTDPRGPNPRCALQTCRPAARQPTLVARGRRCRDVRRPATASGPDPRFLLRSLAAPRRKSRWSPSRRILRQSNPTTQARRGAPSGQQARPEQGRTRSCAYGPLGAPRVRHHGGYGDTFLCEDADCAAIHQQVLVIRGCANGPLFEPARVQPTRRL